ncbi:hypothetical protein BP5796_04776 [Coleophoma crateriformis]|uniref:Uncharacterized protein n=1 Tax=Coleophoma crateriformis TaxID=565419 RepID=A0A3D8SAD2_9HELO|nr:hypothetical protein BP5796_04776 [Coleophoma crateriformis]
MFINAHLRPVLYGFETFVPSRAEVLQPGKRPVDMTNNGVNAWADFRDAASLASTPESCWDHHPDECGGNDTIPVNYPNTERLKVYSQACQPTAIYHRYFQDPSCVFQSQNASFAKNQPYHGYQSHLTGHHRISTLPLYAEQMVAGLRVFDDATSPTLGQPSQTWSHLNRRNNHAPVTHGGNHSKNQHYRSIGESRIKAVPFPSSMALAQPQPSDPTVSPAILDEPFHLHQMSPTTEHSSYSSSTSNSLESSRSAGYNETSIQAQSATSAWWSQELQSNIDPYHLAYSLPRSHDGLPRYEAAHPELEVWDSTNSPSKTLDLHTASTQYVSPQQYSSEKLWASSTSSSSYDAFGSLSDTMEAHAADHSGREVLSVMENLPTRSSHQRRLLPSYPEGDDRTTSILRSNDVDSTEERGKRRPAKVPVAMAKEVSYPSSEEDDGEWQPHKPESKDELRLVEKGEKKSLKPSIPNAQQAEQAQERSAKDEFLVKAKLAGMSYKEIRRQGKFTEAESTLRGRFRTLTKAKNARVRKPEWSGNDVSIGVLVVKTSG